MSDYYSYQQDMANDRQAIAELKGNIKWAQHKLQDLDHITPDRQEIEAATRPAKRTPQESRRLFERWGFDIRNREHREAWKNRHKTSF